MCRNEKRALRLARVSQTAGIPVGLTSQLHDTQNRSRHAGAANALCRQVEVLQDLNHSGSPALVGIDRGIASVVEFGQGNGEGDLLLAEDETGGQGLAEFPEKVGAVGSWRAVAGDELVVGAGAAANLDLVPALAGCHAERLGNNSLVDSALAGGHARGGAGGGKEGEKRNGVHGKRVAGVSDLVQRRKKVI